jgi:hypothetical protein
VEQIRRLSIGPRGRLILFRNGRGFKANFPGNKEACRRNVPGPNKLGSGTIPAYFKSWETRGAADCLILSYAYQLKWV